LNWQYNQALIQDKEKRVWCMASDPFFVVAIGIGYRKNNCLSFKANTPNHGKTSKSSPD
jgi:hypothetical protein